MTTRPGFLGSRPTRLVAWMYSACVFGWPFTTINPSRATSKPTEIMFVASAQSTLPSWWNEPPKPLEREGDLVRRHPRRDLQHFALQGPIAEQPFLFSEPSALPPSLEGVLDLLLNDAAGTSEFAEAVEVGEERHVRIGRVSLVPTPASLGEEFLSAAPIKASMTRRMTTFGLRPVAAMPR